ncbi:uncharacterized protein LOC120261790 [Dioscorea cayenensis subsp. rotundata]|uniref:Uncharacterized protein LOC120261790 n=1 Tax=Dioscorea cayennensis subsp. rotundata TaxID=55577 RepID=A0AB40BF02_DIOCR|nr:uncharacterized protein LOC120261790 [Dioscorea cayenensis subsp. rotundata]
MQDFVLRFVFFCFAAGVAVAFTDGLLPNGNFELGPQPNQLTGTVIKDPHAIPEWETSGIVEYIKAGQKQKDMILVVPEGSFAVRLGNEASIKQRVKNLEKGEHYSLTFSAARTCAQNEVLNISISPDSDVIPMQTMYSSNGWDSYAWAFKAKSSEVDILIHNPGNSEDPDCGPIIDSVAMKTIRPPKLTNKNMLKNGDFEEGPYIIPNTTWGVLIPTSMEDDDSSLPGWIVESAKAVKYLDSAHFSVPSGKHAIELIAGMESAIAQLVRTSLGRSYALAFSIGDANNTCRGSMLVDAYAGKHTIRVPYESKGNGGFKRAVLKFKAESERTRVVFRSSSYNTRSDDLSSLCGPVVDDVSLLSVRTRRLSL